MRALCIAATVIEILLLTAILVVLLSMAAHADGRLQSARPQGMFGEGHAENHMHYDGMTNKQGGSCCNGGDCRPTTARWNAKAGRWEALVQGAWQRIENENLILDDAWLEHIGHPRWDQLSHVCAAERPQSNGTYTVYCLLPAGSGQ